MIGFTIKVFPFGDTVFQDHVAVGTVFFWDGNGAWVEVEVLISEWFPGRYVGMTVEENISWLHWDWGHDIMMVSVGGVNNPVAARDHCIVCHDRKIQYHLVYLCITVSAYTE